MEEDESTARTDLAGIIAALSPLHLLDSENLGSEIQGCFIMSLLRRFQPDP